VVHRYKGVMSYVWGSNVSYHHGMGGSRLIMNVCVEAISYV